MSDSKVAIVGGGMSAIYAYWGCLDAGINPKNIQVYTHKKMIPVGAMFMYECPIPMKCVDLTSILAGTCDEYSYKQWKIHRPSSAHTRFKNGFIKHTDELVWDPNEILPVLWSLIPNVRVVGLLTEEDIEDIKIDHSAVICTFPHIATRKRYADRGLIVSIPIYSNNIQSTHYTCIYNGLQDTPWVRQTTIPGKIYTEYPFYVDEQYVLGYEEARGNGGGEVRSFKDLKPDTPPLSDDQVQEDNLLRVGRMATFRRSYLSHHAKDQVYNFLRHIE